SGLQNGEKVRFVKLSSAGADFRALPGLYRIHASHPSGPGFSASNYAIQYLPGTMTVFAVPGNYIHDTFDRYRLWAKTLPRLLESNGAIHQGIIRHVAGEKAFRDALSHLSSFDLFGTQQQPTHH